MTLFEILETLLCRAGPQGRQLPFRAERTQGQTPLHFAFKHGNLEAALWLMQLVRREGSYAELINATDHVRALRSLSHIGRHAANRPISF